MASCITNKDFEYSKDGKKIFTREFLLRRGYCCQSGCTNCPYEELKEIDPDTPQELKDRWQVFEEDSPEIYEGEIPDGL